MKRLYLTVEGQTEAAFASNVLTPHLANFNVYVAGIRFTGPGRRSDTRVPRGGMFNKFSPTLKEMQLWAIEHKSPDARFSMMVDLYHLPADFPGFAEAMRKNGYIEQVKSLLSSLSTSVGDKRFIPYLQVHEFEALVLVEPAQLSSLYDGRNGRIKELARKCSLFTNPEEINHGQHSHPKYRIKEILPEYDENIAGPELAEAIGLPTLRDRCPHFGAWLTRLEHLDAGGA